ncbi:MAG: OmpA family protein [Saprospiraceae bacterium]|jgi:outer membrane protein OmpA-like peptidoglycan-associated protein/Tol biopolymer transport system component|nr:OmpA family protein [Saprospiraceae bacterium]
MNWKFILAISLCFCSHLILAQQDVVVKNAPNINSDGMEFSPVLYQNGVVYVSRHKNGPVDQKTGETFFELFYAELDPNGFPLKPQDFSTELNSQVHEGPVSFNRRGDQIFFTRSNTQDGKTRADSDGRIGLKIYTAQRGYFDWENIQELPFNDNEYTCMHPSLSPNGKKLFFTSNMPGGYGGYDLYFVERIGEAWSMPINLGPDINTSKNEVFPFIHESGVLFFTSDGHSGMGGLDLFMIDLSGRKWGRVINLGEPFNSESDDLGMVLTPGGARGYFTSNRVDGKGQDDIYFFEAPTGIKGRELYQTLNSVIAVYDKNQSKRVPGAAIRIFETSSDGLINNEDLYNIELLPASAESRELTLKMVRKSDEDLGDPRIITDRNGEAVGQFQENKSYIILVSKDGYQSKEVIHITKDVNLYRPIEVLLEPSNCFSLDGIVTNAKYRQRVPNALVRIVNNCDGSEEIIRTTVDGEFQTCLNVGCEFTIIGEKDGYQNDRTKVSTVKIRGNRSLTAQLKLLPESEQVMKEPIREGTVIVLENIYYDFNKSAIRSGEARDLEALVKLMRTYPSMEIELGAHTDARGTEAYNLRLSLKRAESAKQFMVERGIAANRIKAFGYGEAYPRNRCREGIDCTEVEHQYNRRTEVRILKMDEPLRVQYQDDFNNYKN